MKKTINKIFLLLSAVLLLSGLTACGKTNEGMTYNKAQVNMVTKNVVELMHHSVNPEMADEIAGADEDDLKALESEIAAMGLNIRGSAFQKGYASYLSAVEGDLGEIVQTAENAEVSADDSTITSHIVVTGSGKFPDGSPRTATVEILMTRRGVVESVTFNVDRTFSEKITNAGLNTILGMGTTFCLLIFISVVIWLMGTIVQNVENSRKAKENAEQDAAASVVSQIAEREEQSRAAETTDDAALIAVIAAAIAAYESGKRGTEVSPDAFVVRSLRRR